MEGTLCRPRRGWQIAHGEVEPRAIAPRHRHQPSPPRIGSGMGRGQEGLPHCPAACPSGARVTLGRPGQPRGYRRTGFPWCRRRSRNGPRAAGTSAVSSARLPEQLAVAVGQGRRQRRGFTASSLKIRMMRTVGASTAESANDDNTGWGVAIQRALMVRRRSWAEGGEMALGMSGPRVAIGDNRWFRPEAWPPPPPPPPTKGHYQGEGEPGPRSPGFLI
ncbi:hypothetical protein NHX12_016484 [Muraenolepis orangiensis]|uniref:Uncharacterized protein n=1 Tax=Muraenolepis orangiensis TaxID=630683 RepID=A0A9Q0I0U5_9TELE|nr:hypothetical protein NHX12_016484 [Muraenolepis orangiensis]